MHEQSLVKALLKQVDELCLQHDAEHVTEVRVEVGPLSGVEPMLLTSAFQLLVPESTAVDAVLIVDEVPLSAECKSCQLEFEVSEFSFRCPTCGGNVRVTRGDQVQLVSVTLQGSQSTEELAS